MAMSRLQAHRRALMNKTGAIEAQAPEPEPEEESEPEPMEVDEGGEEDEEPSAEVELSPEQRKAWFRNPGLISDMTSSALSASISKFALPDDTEFFDDIEYAWQNKPKCEEYLEQWVQDRRLHTRIDDLKPSGWFKVKHQEWLKDFGQWKVKNSFRKLAATAKGITPDTAQENNLSGIEKRDLGIEEFEDDRLKGAEMLVNEEVEKMNFDVFDVKDIFDLGGSKGTLFGRFAIQDWALLSLRFELYLLVHAFRKDCPHADRPGFPVEHLAFYYQKYFERPLNLKIYSTDNIEDLLELIQNTVFVRNPGKILDTHLDADLETNDIFAKLAEHGRRWRQLRVDVGILEALQFGPRIALPRDSSAPQITLPLVSSVGQTPWGTKVGLAKATVPGPYLQPSKPWVQHPGQAPIKTPNLPLSSGWTQPLSSGWTQPPSSGWTQPPSSGLMHQAAKWKSKDGA